MLVALGFTIFRLTAWHVISAPGSCLGCVQLFKHMLKETAMFLTARCCTWKEVEHTVSFGDFKKTYKIETRRVASAPCRVWMFSSVAVEGGALVFKS